MSKFYLLIAAINALDLAAVISAKFWSINKNPIFLALTILCFGGAGLFFALSLKYEGMAVANILWIAISVILITFVGYFFFKENISIIQFLGIALIMTGLVLVNWK
ncbi:SMR family transporter [Candidatus Gracilibacteria bacterium]|nr:SMR family transporter [Candidatus Gracilibacteria bacterium]